MKALFYYWITSNLFSLVYGLSKLIELFWHDSTGSMEQLKSTVDQPLTNSPLSKMLCNVYPGLHYFFFTKFGVAENPPLLGYLQSLLQLSSTILPSQAAKTVSDVFEQWNDGMESGILSSEDIGYLKKSIHKKKTTILPTVQDKCISLHESFGLLCRCDDEHLKKEFKNLNNVDFLCFGDLNHEEKKSFGIRFLSYFRISESLCFLSNKETLSEEVSQHTRTHTSTTISH
ncbi:unnamed protein product [Lactuca saligna]|uniref:Uncharacterized protein n=1 Tax=Lactuca saligna TaxID=75948 RepID=A0AA36A665_LACSI|nr:unnamed protein product [Lactuca saligna]